MRIASNGTMIGAPGYEGAHVIRKTIPEDDIVWLLPPNGRADGKVIHLDDKLANSRQRTLKREAVVANRVKIGVSRSSPGKLRQSKTTCR